MLGTEKRTRQVLAFIQVEETDINKEMCNEGSFRWGKCYEENGKGVTMAEVREHVLVYGNQGKPLKGRTI